jgi:NAD(P)-dependent dehydrogenase (short-subunit alcohol dehydrogenase family)
MMKEILGNEKILAQVLKNTPLGKMGKTEDVVGAVVFFESDHITGQTIAIDGGFAMSKI